MNEKVGGVMDEYENGVVADGPVRVYEHGRDVLIAVTVVMKDAHLLDFFLTREQAEGLFYELRSVLERGGQEAP